MPALERTPAALNAALVGAKTVNWPLALKASATPLSFSAATKLECMGEALILSMMSRSGIIAFPPIMGLVISILTSGTGLGSERDTAPSAPPIIIAAPADRK